MKTRSIRDRINNRRRVRWQKPSTGSFIKDCIIGNKAAMEWLRRLAEEREKQSAACAPQKSS